MLTFQRILPPVDRPRAASHSAASSAPGLVCGTGLGFLYFFFGRLSPSPSSSPSSPVSSSSSSSSSSSEDGRAFAFAFAFAMAGPAYDILGAVRRLEMTLVHPAADDLAFADNVIVCGKHA